MSMLCNPTQMTHEYFMTREKPPILSQLSTDGRILPNGMTNLRGIKRTLEIS